MPFGDPILGGNTLIRDAIQSGNYVLNTSGWAINVDGTAQFFNVTIIGNDLKVIGSNGSLVEILSSAGGTQAEVLLSPPTQTGGVTQLPGGLVAFAQTPGSPKPVLQVFSPTFNGNASAGINIQGASADNATPSLINLLTSMLQVNGSQVWVLAHLDQLDCSGNLTLGGASTLIPGCTVTYTGLPAGSTWDAELSVDSSIGGTSGVTNVGELWVQLNGGTLTKATGDINSSPGINTRVPGSRTWSGTIAAGGTLHIEAHGRFIGGGGVNAFFSPHTTLQVHVNE